ncbi:MAG: ABC transporter ATP-binding protein/permease [Oscillospiraceae bacterium]|nr:ABC transporter ATP-binding protein/permease [Oscillospiraceae bacterium]
MLELRDIRKKYVTGELVQTALDGVSLTLRDNEFVAILGPSGSGKTTMLNIIGGLDRYDSGDLIINGISTKQYTDRDWDSYRNHTIGFVFQSYNLIPHQTVLSNVELALTISGVSRAERRQRAIKALEEVGLGDQIHKKPNQMSGGQMQRVAIARALVNDPDILLADEPTGALDTRTSLQVMDLLKQVANDRLVVMVTHNPELAEQYANRIVKVRDGRIIDDSNPFHASTEVVKGYENMGKSSMSFLTSMALSFNNLKTKKGRTFLTAFAGSIGIIGIALIMSLSNGVDKYIKSVEEDTLSEYPLTIQSTGMDISRLIERPASSSETETATEIEEEKKGEVRERQIVKRMFSGVTKNDLKSLRTFIESRDSHVYDHANAVEYTYSVTPQIFKLSEDGLDYRQVNPDKLITARTGSNSMYSTFMSGGGGASVFSALPENEGLYKQQYDVLAGRWPENYRECILVLTGSHSISDLTLYILGLKDAKELDKVFESLQKNEEIEINSTRGKYDFEDFIGIEFRIVDIADFYDYDSEFNVYVNKTDNKDYMLAAVRDGTPLTIVGVMRPNDSGNASMLSSGIYYTHDLVSYTIDRAAGSEIVRKQIADPSIDVFTGKEFARDEGNGIELKDLITVNRDSFAKAFRFDPDKLEISEDMFSDMDLSNMDLDLSKVDFTFPGLDSIDVEKIMQEATVRISQEELQRLFNRLIEGYVASSSRANAGDIESALREYLASDEAEQILRQAISDVLADQLTQVSSEAVQRMVIDIMSGFAEYARANAGEDTDVASLVPRYLATDRVRQKIDSYSAQMTGEITITPRMIDAISQRLIDGFAGYNAGSGDMTQSFSEYLSSPEGMRILQEGLSKAIDADKLQEGIENAARDASAEYSRALQKEISVVMESIMKQVMAQVAKQMESRMGKIGENMTKAFSFDSKAMSNAIKINMTADDLQELMMSMMSGENATYENNLRKLNYADLEVPVAISIYPIDFEGKERIIDILDGYNDRMDKAGEKDKVITYTDYVGTLMSSVTNIIDTISYVLIAFVAISLVVSSIMIGIITYISVLERTKEIGILRAIGASKRNVSQVFNAETFIIGLLAGVIGIIVTLLLLIPGNAIIHAISGNNDINAILPVAGAIALIIISVILTLIGGIIPSKSAAKKDPVTALRTE